MGAFSLTTPPVPTWPLLHSYQFIPIFLKTSKWKKQNSPGQESNVILCHTLPVRMFQKQENTLFLSFDINAKDSILKMTIM